MVPSNKKQLGYFEEIIQFFSGYLFSINEEDWKSLHRRLINQRKNYEAELSMGAEFLAVTRAMICTQPPRSFAIISPIQCTDWSN